MLPFSLPAPAGFDSPPIWEGCGFRLGGKHVAVLEYSENFAGWSDELTTLHEQAAADAHPIDRASRSGCDSPTAASSRDHAINDSRGRLFVGLHDQGHEGGVSRRHDHRFRRV